LRELLSIKFFYAITVELFYFAGKEFLIMHLNLKMTYLQTLIDAIGEVHTPECTSSRGKF
jgi:hypothetical protein